MKISVSPRSGIGVIALACVVVCCLPSAVFALSANRVYEMVSPPYKGGYGANRISAVAPDGQSVAFLSPGAFAGAPASQAVNTYLARRGASEWATVSLLAPATIAPDGGLKDYSADLGLSVSETNLGTNAGTALDESDVTEFLLHDSSAPDTSAGFVVAGMPLTTVEKERFLAFYLGAASNLSHLVFQDEPSFEAFLPKNVVLSQQIGNDSTLYDLATGIASVPSLRLVEVNNSGGVIDRFCSPSLGSGSARESLTNAISEDGSEIFFTENVNPGEGAACNAATKQVFVRVDGSRTVEVSRPLGKCSEVPCSGATTRAPSEYQGASTDGKRVFFTTAEPLAAGDVDTSNNLYVAGVGCPGGVSVCESSGREMTSLVQVSRDLHAGDRADVQGVVAIGSDGSHAYFVARGVLGETANVEGRSPMQGADNLYVYDTDTGAAPVFVADLCSGPEKSGEARDVACPASLNEGTRNDMSLWASAHPEAQTADGGRFVLFGSYGQLRGGVGDGDTDETEDIYRYDAVTGVLDRVSTGEAGFDANGNGGEFGATIRQVQIGEAFVSTETGVSSRAMSEDGARVVFTSADPLSPAAVNGRVNAYEWQAGSGPHEGAVSLVSTGSSTGAVEDVVMSQSGDDIFFSTSQGLVAQDTDGAPDVYDARVDGGFQASPTERQPCSGDACQGPLTNPAPLLLPGSLTQQPGEDLSPAKKPVTAPKKTVVKKKKKARKTVKRRKKAKSTKKAKSIKRLMTGDSAGRQVGGGR